ncbi:hypothetical protein K438DRAFT_2001431 [Mycena galopus ATCC 62051]|nr:hypothetical protein K438DRAFT_2001431 [Mycena galopus ATCC 62051]
MTHPREYTSAQLHSAHSYNEPSLLDVSLQRCLPTFSSYTARTVKQEGRTWTIWSPNSQQSPFYPGHCVPLPGQVVLPAEVEQRQCDGHGGRWDYSLFPQAFSPLRPWLGLMKRKGRHLETEHEFASPLTVWNVNAGEINWEYIDLLITRNAGLEEAMSLRIPTAQQVQPPLHSQRPVYPKLQNLNGLKTVKTFNKAVDKLRECQRGMREKQAWVTLMSLIVEFPLEREARFGREVKVTDNSYLGVWINGTEDRIVEWMLVQGAIPCFLIAAPPRGILVDRPRDGFSAGTNIKTLSSPSYAYDSIAKAQNLGFTTIEANPIVAESIHHREVEKIASNLHWQLELPWAYPLFASNGHPETVERSIRALRVPPIASNTASKGAWEVFAEDLLEYDKPDLGPVMRLRAKGKGKTNQGDNDEMWYNRAHKRKLIFSDLPPLPAGSVIRDDEFGRPVPSWPFGLRSNNDWVGKAPSIWMYRRPEAKKGWVGESIVIPRLR